MLIHRLARSLQRDCSRSEPAPPSTE